MKPISKEGEIAESVVRQYALGLSTLNLELIAPILDNEFKFVYRVGDRGHGIRTDVRYIGHLYKTFLAMIKEVQTLKTDFCYLEQEDVRFLGIKLLPPHSRGIIYPMDYQLIESERSQIPETEVYLLPRVKNGLLCKIECYTPSELYYFKIDILENELELK